MLISAKAVISNMMHERIYVNYVYKIYDGLTLMLDIISFMIVKACIIYNSRLKYRTFPESFNQSICRGVFLIERKIIAAGDIVACKLSGWHGLYGHSSTYLYT